MKDKFFLETNSLESIDNLEVGFLVKAPNGQTLFLTNAAIRWMASCIKEENADA